MLFKEILFVGGEKLVKISMRKTQTNKQCIEAVKALELPRHAWNFHFYITIMEAA